MRKPLFCNRLFGLLELHLVLLGSSRPLPGQSWGPDGSQKTSKSGPKFGQKWVQKGIQFWIALEPFLGLVLGSKTVSSAGTIFQCFSGWLQSSLLAPSWLHFGSFLASLGFLLGPTWFFMFRLGTHVIIKNQKNSPSYPGMMVKWMGV